MTGATSVTTIAHSRLVGNRLTLIGAIVYLLEFVGIIAAGAPVPSKPGMGLDAVISLYATHSLGIAFEASWLSLVLLGRVAFAVGLRSALKRSGVESALTDLAVGAVVISVVVEICAYAFAGAAAQIASAGGSPATVIGLDAASNWFNLAVIAPGGVFAVASALAMWSSGLFARWICWMGLVGGGALVLFGVMSGPALVVGGTFSKLAAVFAIAALGFWIWMLATGVVLWRRTGRAPLDAVTP